MTKKPDDPRESTGVADLRAELKDDLLRAARARQTRRSSLRRLAPIALGVALAAAPATLAVAELSSDDRTTEFAVPAPAPLFSLEGGYADCPKDVQELIIRLEGDLDAYADSPGYPVAGCPTAEELDDVSSAEASEPEEGVVTLKRLEEVEPSEEGEGTLQSPERTSPPGSEAAD